jgi:hypothetical protein
MRRDLRRLPMDAAGLRELIARGSWPPRDDGLKYAEIAALSMNSASNVHASSEWPPATLVAINGRSWRCFQTGCDLLRCRSNGFLIAADIRALRRDRCRSRQGRAIQRRTRPELAPISPPCGDSRRVETVSRTVAAAPQTSATTVPRTAASPGELRQGLETAPQCPETLRQRPGGRGGVLDAAA